MGSGNKAGGTPALDNTVLHYGLGSALQRRLRRLGRELGLFVIEAGSIADLLAVPGFLQVVNPRATAGPGNGWTTWLNHWAAVASGPATAVLLTRPAPWPIPAAAKPQFITTPTRLDAKRLKFIILRRRAAVRRRVRAARRYDRKLFRLVKILKIVREEGLAKPTELCREFNVSRKSVQRDVQLLNMAGYCLEWDPVRGGYVSPTPDALADDGF